MSANFLGDYDVFLLKFGLDTDGDGFADREEINSGTDPLNFFDNWLSRGVIIFVIPLSSITVLIVFYVFKRKKKVNQKNVIIKKGDT